MHVWNSILLKPRPQYFEARKGVTSFRNSEDIPQGEVFTAALYAIGTAPIFKHVDGLAKENCADGGSTNAYVDNCNVSSSDQGIVSSLDYFDVFVDDGIHMNIRKIKVLISQKPTGNNANICGTRFYERGILQEHMLIHPSM